MSADRVEAPLTSPLTAGDTPEPPVASDLIESALPRVTFADVAGMQEVKQRLERALLAPMRNPELTRLERVVDRAFYLQANPDIAAAIRDPIRHFHDFGAKEGRLASPWFSPSYVYAQLGQDSLHGRSVQSVYAASGQSAGRSGT